MVLFLGAVENFGNAKGERVNFCVKLRDGGRMIRVSCRVDIIPEKFQIGLEALQINRQLSGVEFEDVNYLPIFDEPQPIPRFILAPGPREHASTPNGNLSRSKKLMQF